MRSDLRVIPSVIFWPYRKSHPSKITEGVTDENSRRKPIVISKRKCRWYERNLKHSLLMLERKRRILRHTINTTANIWFSCPTGFVSLDSWVKQTLPLKILSIVATQKPGGDCWAELRSQLLGIVPPVKQLTTEAGTGMVCNHTSSPLTPARILIAFVQKTGNSWNTDINKALRLGTLTRKHSHVDVIQQTQIDRDTQNWT